MTYIKKEKSPYFKNKGFLINVKLLRKHKA
jgi:hypothetical protein